MHYYYTSNIPSCPKCTSFQTTDVDPFQELAEEQSLSEYREEVEKGKSRFYCQECGYSWKKYRGKKPYSRIKSIEAFAGGFPGPSFKVKIDLENYIVEHVEYAFGVEIGQENFMLISEEEKDWFLTELYKSDLLNWSDEYYMMAMDGSHWNLKIVLDTHCEIKSGSNHFPAKWAKFRKVVAKISGGEFY